MANKKGTGYYDISTESGEIPVTWDLDELFYLKDIKQRKMFINEAICIESISDIVKNILQFNREDVGIQPDKRQPILLYVTTNGGDVDAGFQLIDVIVNSITPVYTINLGYQYSMGFLIGIAGHKRFATKNAKYLIHDGASFVYDSGQKVQDQVRFQERVWGRIRDFVLERGSITREEYDKNLRVEWYMFADEAKERGFVDFIIGEDCNIEEIL